MNKYNPNNLLATTIYCNKYESDDVWLKIQTLLSKVLRVEAEIEVLVLCLQYNKFYVHTPLQCFYSRLP